MSRRKKRASVLPWFSAQWDTAGEHYIQIADSLVQSKKFQSLRDSSKILYFCLGTEARGKRTVKLSRKQAEKKYGIKPATYSRSKNELIEEGLIRIVPDTGRYETNCFEFLLDWKNKNHVSD